MVSAPNCANALQVQHQSTHNRSNTAQKSSHAQSPNFPILQRRPHILPVVLLRIQTLALLAKLPCTHHRLLFIAEKVSRVRTVRENEVCCNAEYDRWNASVAASSVKYKTEGTWGERTYSMMRIQRQPRMPEVPSKLPIAKANSPPQAPARADATKR